MSELPARTPAPAEQRHDRPSFEAKRETSARGLALTLFALLVLAGLSLAFRFADLGAVGFAIAMAIAVAKAVLVAVFFMEITAERPTVGFAFVTGVVLVVVLVAFMLADIVTRTVPPIGNPPGTADRSFG